MDVHTFPLSDKIVAQTNEIIELKAGLFESDTLLEEARSLLMKQLEYVKDTRDALSKCEAANSELSISVMKHQLKDVAYKHTAEQLVEWATKLSDLSSM